PGYDHGRFWCSRVSGVQYDKEQLSVALNTSEITAMKLEKKKTSKPSEFLQDIGNAKY
ncbi:unnamed protein product, partial [Bubo scandiacus]